MTNLTPRNRSSLTVNLTHILADEVLSVCEPLTLDRVPARQRGIPLAIRRQFDVGGLILLFDIILITRRTDP